MPHDVTLIAVVAAGLGLALVLGLAVHRSRVRPLALRRQHLDDLGTAPYLSPTHRPLQLAAAGQSLAASRHSGAGSYAPTFPPARSCPDAELG